MGDDSGDEAGAGGGTEEWLRRRLQVCTFDEGSVYMGTQSDRTKHGHGTFYWTGGNSHTGAWHEDKMHRHCTHTLADGNSYMGAFCDNMRHGHGRHTWADETSYEGAWHKTCGCSSRSISSPGPRSHPQKVYRKRKDDTIVSARVWCEIFRTRSEISQDYPLNLSISRKGRSGVPLGYLFCVTEIMFGKTPRRDFIFELRRGWQKPEVI